ncbi:MAG: aspartate carbamoyltransferase catalytic subunit [Acidimicrobiia bacterium]|nr:aspartate carbamoyltransferase catalytic subunit [Acidimicrobiia bacterium]
MDDLDVAGIREIVELSDAFEEVLRRPIPKVPALRGRTVANVFFEDSTRTRLSFEIAAKRLSADTVNFTASGSSLSKGESLFDTIRTLHAMGVDAFVVRHRAPGAARRVDGWVDTPVINAGDGAHEHPTQALLDLVTVHRRRGDVEGLRCVMVGDIEHSRVARSTIGAFTMMGMHVSVAAPATLLPTGIDDWPVDVVEDLDTALEKADVVYMLRMQKERIARDPVLPSLREYVARYGLTAERARRLPPEVVLMHPGPMNRGVEIAPEATEHPGAAIEEQVRNGVTVRMAVLYLALGGMP